MHTYIHIYTFPALSLKDQKYITHTNTYTLLHQAPQARGSVQACRERNIHILHIQTHILSYIRLLKRMAVFKPAESLKDQKSCVETPDGSTRTLKLGDICVEQTLSGEGEYVVRVSFGGKAVERRYEKGTLVGVNLFDANIGAKN